MVWVVLAVLCLHAWLLAESPAWFSPSADKQSQTLTFVTRQIDASPRAPQKPQTPVESTPNKKSTTNTPTTAPTPTTPQPPIHFDASHPNLTAPVALPERAASAVDLPPFQRTNSEGLTEPTSAQTPASAMLNYAVQGMAKGFQLSRLSPIAVEKQLKTTTKRV